MNYTINSTKPVIIGIDHGYGNIKTAHAVFKTGVTVYDKEPTFKNNLLIYGSRYYIIGDEHKEFAAEKMNDPDYYILTLAAIGIELHLRGETVRRFSACENLPLAAFRRDGRCHPAPSIFFCMRQKKQKRLPAGSRKDVIHYGNLSSGSKGREPWRGALGMCGLGLYELLRHLQRL